MKSRIKLLSWIVGTSLGLCGTLVRADDSRLWGFADLHSHPAAHLGFGATADQPGLFYGKPGLGLEESQSHLAEDLAACQPDKHSGFDLDPVRHQTRKTIISSLNELTGAPHSASGFPDFFTWPSARHGFHQQMHISWLRRAYDGGLRILVASAVENISFSQLWNHGLNFTAPEFKPDPALEFESAKRQLSFIRQQVAANPSWMQLVTTATEAREVVRGNKLAVVLAVEMDTLTADQILILKRDYGLRLVTPIHTADNSFGGAAIYEDIFNTHNFFLNQKFFTVEGDPNLAFRLGVPLYPRVETSLAIWDGPGAVIPTAIEHDQFCALGYDCCDEAGAPERCFGPPLGHKNAKGLLAPDQLQRLMAEGLMIDLAHMSDASQTDSVTLAERFHYPLLNTHSHLREDAARASSERDMRSSLATRMTELGGMIGLGMGGEMAEGLKTERTILSVLDPKVQTQGVRLTGDQKSWTLATAPLSPASDSSVCASFSLSIDTGDDDLRGGDDRAALRYQLNGRSYTQFLSGLESWSAQSRHTVRIVPPAGTRQSDLESLMLLHAGPSGSNDAWTVNAITVSCDRSSRIAVQASGHPLMRFTGDRKTLDLAIPSSPIDFNLGTEARVTITTGDDDLRGGDDQATLVFLFKDRSISCPLNKGAKWGNGSIQTVRCALPDGLDSSKLTGIRVETNFRGGWSGDNWNLDGIKLELIGGSQDIVNLKAQPLLKLTREQRLIPIFARIKGIEPVKARLFKLHVHTGGDDLRGGDDQAWIDLLYRDGSLQTEALSRTAALTNGSSMSMLLRLSEGRTIQDLLQLRIRTSLSGGVSGDNWNIARIELEAFADPVKQFNQTMAQSLRIMKGRGVAFGTDFNGLSATIPILDQRVRYPWTLPDALQPAGRRITMDQAQTGNRRFDVTFDGIAHVGLLPDFLFALAQDAGAEAIDPLIHAADDFVRMWEKIESAAPFVP